MVFAHSFLPLINKPTRVSRNNATVIDHLLSNSFINKNYLTGIVKTDISDHFPVFLIAETDVKKSQKSSFVFKRVINDSNLKKFNDLLLTVNWTNVLKNTDPNIAYDEFLDIFLTHYNYIFPMRKLKLSQKPCKSLDN